MTFGGFGFIFKKSLLSFYSGSIPHSLLQEDPFLTFLGIVNKGILFSKEKLRFYRRLKGSMSSPVDERNNTEEIVASIARLSVWQNSVLVEKLKYLSGNGPLSPYYQKNKFWMKVAINRSIIINCIHINFAQNKSNIKNIIILYLNIYGIRLAPKYTFYLIFPNRFRKYICKIINNRIKQFHQ